MKTLNTVLHIATSVKCPIIALKKVIYTRNAHGGTEGDRKMAEQQLENHYSVHVNYRLKGKGTTLHKYKHR